RGEELQRARLAVLITYHGEQHLIGECLRSLDVDGSVPDEVLVFDDASDVPLNVTETYGFALRTARSERNIGLSAARNRLAELTSCEYIHFHDADDVFAANWARRIRETLNRPDSADAIFCEVSIVAFDGVTLEAERGQGLAALRANG